MDIKKINISKLQRFALTKFVLICLVLLLLAVYSSATAQKKNVFKEQAELFRELSKTEISPNNKTKTFLDSLKNLSNSKESKSIILLAEASLKSRESSYEDVVALCQSVIQDSNSEIDFYILGQAYNQMADAYKRMGSAHFVQELRIKALSYAKTGLDFFEKANDIEGQVISYNTLGIILRDLDRISEARKSYKKGLALAEEHRFESAILGILHANTGQAIMEADKNYDLAINEYDRAIELYSKFGRESSKEHAYRNKALAYAGKGDQKNALKFAAMAVQKAKDLNSSHRLMNALRVSRDVQSHFGLYELAFKSLESLKVLEDSVSKADKIKAINEVSTKYETAEKEKQINNLSLANSLKKQQLIIALISVLTLSVLVIQLYRQKKKIEQNRHKIQEQSEELKLMMRELHHRVKNNLSIVSSLLNIQSGKLNDNEAKEAIKQGQQRVEAMSLIHQKLYKTEKIASINIRDFIGDLSESLMVSYGYSPANFDLEIEVEKKEIDIDLAIPLGLIMNELLTNSFKYAFSEAKRPLLSIKLLGTSDMELRIKDNGVGIDENSWGKSKSGFGQKLISGLSRQIGGQLSILNDAGTLLVLKIPVNNSNKAA